MSLRHYTANLESAKSIIASKELWLRRTGEAPKDKNEINHYFKIFNEIHFLKALKIIKETTVYNNKYQKSIPLAVKKIQNIYQELWYRENDVMIGNVLQDIIKEQSHIICFTKEDSAFHASTYGDICFEFSANPLKNISSFKFFEEPIKYFKTTQFENIKKYIDDFQKNFYQNFLPNDILNKPEKSMAQIKKYYLEKELSKKSKKDLIIKLNKEIDSVLLQPEIIELIKIFESFITTFKLSDEKYVNVVKYLAGIVDIKRESKILKYFDFEQACNFRENKVFRNFDIEQGHFTNLVACFIKDEEFIKDAETRIIALPNSPYNIEESFLRVPYDPVKLKKIIIAPTIEEEIKTNYINEIIEALKLVGSDNVLVE